MITLNQVQASLVTKLKNTTTITSLLNPPGSSNEIREIQWHGKTTTYPAVRVRVVKFKRQTPELQCNNFDVEVEILIFCDDASSMNTNDIASAVFNLFDTVSFGDSVIKIPKISAEQLGGVWVEESGLWQSQVNLSFRAH